jgi:HTH-type transcriptional repressor of NAD biosynthesis genes
LAQKKKYSKGFILGKFLPPHKGHLYMIQKALEQTEDLTVLVCTIKKEPIAGHLRFQWMKELLPKVNVVHVKDEVPSYPSEHADFWEIWTSLLKREIDPKTEVFFSSEDYGDEVASRLGIKHVLIDKNRSVIPISATAIRADPFDNWEFIPDNVKPYYLKRIVLTGPESTGKTTLSKALANYYKTEWVQEFGRDYFVKRNGKLVFEDIIKIGQGQLDLEEAAAKKANKFLFCDTDLIVTQIWSEIYFNSCPSELINLNKDRKYDLYLLMDIDIPWADDGTREFPNLREWHFNRLKKELEERNLNYVIIQGSDSVRIQQCIAAINNLT